MTALQQPAPTFEDVWRAIQELVQLGKETDRKFQETERLMKEHSTETDRKFQETDRKIKEVARQIGNLGGRLGQFVEEMVRPAAVRLFQGRGLDVHQVIKNLTAYDDNGQFRSEIDLLVINNKTAIAIECKSHLSVDDVKEHIERMGMFKDCYPQYAEFILLGAVAAMVIPEDVARYAYCQGLYVLAQSGETVQIRNDDRFEPQTW